MNGCTIVRTKNGRTDIRMCRLMDEMHDWTRERMGTGMDEWINGESTKE